MTASQVTVDSLRAFVVRLLTGHGATPDEAAVFADALIWSDLVGHAGHGLWRLPTYLKRLRLGLIQSPCHPKWSKCGPAVEVLDGGAGFGQYVAHTAMSRAIELARAAGAGVVGVRNSNHFGAAGYYAKLATDQSMVGLAMSNAFRKVAPYGGIKPVFGTNALAFGAPRRDEGAVLIDMATASIAGSAAIRLAAQGSLLPEGVAVDASGAPITDPRGIREGALLPFGGAKGSGIALMVEILSSVITGGALSAEVASMFDDFERAGGNSHFFVALDIARFIPLQSYYDRLEALLALIRASRSGVDSNPVLIPGELRVEALQRARRDGVHLDAEVARMLREMAAAEGIASPL
jgi:LDH2 family malate/lactate/ureidoglycolate dehydrogenase